ncbi:uncharacterized protein LOC107646021 isoform X2 [Arachis ipaensis]|uniref:uncharacterized protein LOC107646021 isoform X2 n=1 Tax=Arachis ipaensis TaxID=130454 RepID=UPI0007AF0373|nr:uncharacterized protein LOC107646021 isoform X2 [Arachis ipaensis]XP_025662794.1 uncharacterized protein LOC112758360 isoform X3 [Arachis hypogaea]
MAEDDSDRPLRIMNFVSEDQLVEAKRTRGERVEDGTAQRDRPLYEILKENKDKKDAEFNERFKHSECSASIEYTRREYERKVADAEAEELRSFQAAVAAQSNFVHEIKERAPLPMVQEEKSAGVKKNPSSRPLSMIIKVKPQAKKAKADEKNAEKVSKAETTLENDDSEPQAKKSKIDGANADVSRAETTTEHDKPKSSDPAQSLNALVSYSDESDEDL